jgi:hypothetical protein
VGRGPLSTPPQALQNRFNRLIDLLITDIAVEQAVEQAFEDVDFKAMDDDFKAHILKM